MAQVSPVDEPQMPRHALARRSGWLPYALIVLVLGAAGVAVWRSGMLAPPALVTEAPIAQAPTAPVAVPAPVEEPVAPGSPADADALLRQLASGLSTNPLLAGWL